MSTSTTGSKRTTSLKSKCSGTRSTRRIYCPHCQTNSHDGNDCVYRQKYLAEKYGAPDPLRTRRAHHDSSSSDDKQLAPRNVAPVDASTHDHRIENDASSLPLMGKSWCPPQSAVVQNSNDPSSSVSTSSAMLPNCPPCAISVVDPPPLPAPISQDKDCARWRGAPEKEVLERVEVVPGARPGEHLNRANVNNLPAGVVDKNQYNKIMKKVDACTVRSNQSDVISQLACKNGEEEGEINEATLHKSAKKFGNANVQVAAAKSDQLVDDEDKKKKKRKRAKRKMHKKTKRKKKLREKFLTSMAFATAVQMFIRENMDDFSNTNSSSSSLSSSSSSTSSDCSTASLNNYSASPSEANFTKHNSKNRKKNSCKQAG